MTPLRERTEDSCVIWDPWRHEFEAQHIQVFRGQGMCFYPIWFPGATTVTAGHYWVLWRERKQIWRDGKFVGPGKWLPVDFYRIKITEDELDAAGVATRLVRPSP